MKTVVLFLLSVYKLILSPLLNQLFWQGRVCRYEVSCSEYAKQVISKDGVLKGGKKALLRLLSCQPFSKPYANFSTTNH